MKAVDSGDCKPPALREAQDMAKKLAYAQRLGDSNQRHPDIQQVVADEKFKDWIKASPSRMLDTNMPISQVMLMKLMILFRLGKS